MPLLAPVINAVFIINIVKVYFAIDIMINVEKTYLIITDKQQFNIDLISVKVHEILCVNHYSTI
ncbi:hypothetical protein GCM10011397_17880 [Wenyingzhuangia marina]|nr:hypothetical protein GCM10011397_17880 [Wenyingzhuangia marina]